MGRFDFKKFEFRKKESSFQLNDGVCNMLENFLEAVGTSELNLHTGLPLGGFAFHQIGA